jgi:hypothetical protein
MAMKSVAGAESRSEDSTEQFRDKYNALLRVNSSESETVESGGYSFETDSASEGTDLYSFANSELDSIDGSLSPREEFLLDAVCGWLDRPMCLMPGQQQSLLVQSTQAAALRNVKFNETLLLAAKAEISDGEDGQSDADSFVTTDDASLLDSESLEEQETEEDAVAEIEEDYEMTVKVGEDDESVEVSLPAEDDSLLRGDNKIAADESSDAAIEDKEKASVKPVLEPEAEEEDDMDHEHELDLFLSESEPSNQASPEEPEGADRTSVSPGNSVNAEIIESYNQEPPDAVTEWKQTNEPLKNPPAPRMPSSEAEPVDLTLIEDDIDLQSSPSKNSFTEKIQKDKTVSFRTNRDPMPSKRAYRTIDDEVEREVSVLWQQEEVKVNRRLSPREAVDEYSPRSPLLHQGKVKRVTNGSRGPTRAEKVDAPIGEKTTRTSRPDPVEATKMVRKGPSPEMGPRQIASHDSISSISSRQRSEDSNDLKMRDFVAVRSIGASQKLRESRERSDKPKPRYSSPRANRVMQYGSRPVNNESNSIDVHEYMSQREMHNREARNSDRSSRRASESRGVREGAQSYSRSVEMASTRSKAIGYKEVTDLTGISSDHGPLAGPSNYYFGSSHDIYNGIDSSRDEPVRHVNTHSFDESKKKRDKLSSSNSKPDLASVAGLKKLEKKIEEQFKQSQDPDYDNRVSTQELRKLERELVQQLQRVDEKRATKLDRLRKKNKNRPEEKNVAAEKRSQKSVPTSHKPFTKKTTDVRESNRYDQLQSLRLSKEMGRYIGRS